MLLFSGQVKKIRLVASNQTNNSILTRATVSRRVWGIDPQSYRAQWPGWACQLPSYDNMSRGRNIFGGILGLVVCLLVLSLALSTTPINISVIQTNT